MLQLAGSLLEGEKNSAFTRSNTENKFWYKQFHLRQIKMLYGGQSVVQFGAADNCRLDVMTMKATKFRDDYPSIAIDNFEDHQNLVFGFNSTQDELVESCIFNDKKNSQVSVEQELLLRTGSQISKRIVWNFTPKKYCKRLLGPAKPFQ